MAALREKHGKRETSTFLICFSLLVLHIICYNFCIRSLHSINVVPKANRITYKCGYQQLLLVPILIRDCAFNQSVHENFLKTELSAPPHLIYFFNEKTTDFPYNCAASKKIEVICLYFDSFARTAIDDA